MQSAAFTYQQAHTADQTYRVFEANSNELRFFAVVDDGQIVFETSVWTQTDLPVLS